MKKIVFLFVIIGIGLLFLFMTINRNDISDNISTGDIKKVDVAVSSLDEKSKTTPIEESNKIDDKIAMMSIDEKIGQLIIGGFPETTLTTETKELIQTYKLGGFIFFQRNLETPDQSIRLINEINRENKQNNIPLFLSVDQEGGGVTRLPGLPELLTNNNIGLHKDESFSFKTGELLARQLSAYGMNLNFAPVLDVNNNPNNIVIGNRSFSSNPEVVSSYGINMLKGMQAENIIPVIKHFPGHGDTNIDSHDSLPVIHKGLKQLEDIELIPFKEAIDNGADVVMTGHIHLPQLGTNYPATLSKEVIDDLLRTQLNFDGVIITDDLTMGAISNDYGLTEASVLAIQAGVDILLVAHEYENIVAVFEGIKDAVQSGELAENRIDESLERILSLKDKYDLNDEVVPEIMTQRLTDEVSELYGN